MKNIKQAIDLINKIEESAQHSIFTSAECGKSAQQIVSQVTSIVETFEKELQDEDREDVLTWSEVIGIFKIASPKRDPTMIKIHKTKAPRKYLPDYLYSLHLSKGEEIELYFSDLITAALANLNLIITKPKSFLKLSPKDVSRNLSLFKNLKKQLDEFRRNCTLAMIKSLKNDATLLKDIETFYEQAAKAANGSKSKLETVKQIATENEKFIQLLSADSTIAMACCLKIADKQVEIFPPYMLANRILLTYSTVTDKDEEKIYSPAPTTTKTPIIKQVEFPTKADLAYLFAKKKDEILSKITPHLPISLCKVEWKVEPVVREGKQMHVIRMVKGFKVNKPIDEQKCLSFQKKINQTTGMKIDFHKEKNSKGSVCWTPEIVLDSPILIKEESSSLKSPTFRKGELASFSLPATASKKDSSSSLPSTDLRKTKDVPAHPPGLT